MYKGKITIIHQLTGHITEEWNPICCQNGNPGIGWFSGDHPQCCGNCKGFIII